jgi:hypothetical protein
MLYNLLQNDIIQDNLYLCFSKTTINTYNTNSLKYHIYFLCCELVTFTYGLFKDPVRSSDNTELNVLWVMTEEGKMQS